MRKLFISWLNSLLINYSFGIFNPEGDPVSPNAGIHTEGIFSFYYVLYFCITIGGSSGSSFNYLYLKFSLRPLAELQDQLLPKESVELFLCKVYTTTLALN